MKIFYMNQGGGGQWGAIGYSEYEVLCLAEWSGGAKGGFSEVYLSQEKPSMSVQIQDGSRSRTVTAIKDIDHSLEAVRPLLLFQLVGGVHVVFFHLKSGSETLASKELEQAAKGVASVMDTRHPILWVGDYNRAVDDGIVRQFGGFTTVYKGGGYSEWYLDRVGISGNWGKLGVTVERVTTSALDHGHVGLRIVIE